MIFFKESTVFRMTFVTFAVGGQIRTSLAEFVPVLLIDKVE
jgi:hypothetical protein